jgi:hypothetical protein
MANFDEDFETFQERLRETATIDPLVWRLRDSIYHDLRYARVGHDEPRRHRLGKFSWNGWFLQKLIRAKLSAIARESPRDRPRFGFLFYGSHEAHFATLLPIVREIAVNEAVTVWWLELREDQLSILHAMRNVTLISIGPWTSKAGWSARSCISDVRAASRLHAKLASCAALSPDDRFQTRKKISEITETIFEYLRWKRIWRSADESLPEVALFVTSESTPIAKAFRDVMRDNGRRVVHLLHGLPNTTHQVTGATDLCVFSASQKRWFEQRVDRDVHVVTIGNPRLEQLRKVVAPLRERKIGDRFRLLYFSQTTGSYYNREQRRADLSILTGGGSDLTKLSLRIRPHPAEPVNLLQDDIGSAGITSWEISTGSLIGDLSWCDVSATNFSTALLEAAVCGRICYWLNSGGFVFASVKALCKDGIGKPIRSSTEWRDEIGRIARLETPAPAKVTESQLRTLGILPEKAEPWLQRLHVSQKPTLSGSQ